MAWAFEYTCRIKLTGMNLLLEKQLNQYAIEPGSKMPEGFDGLLECISQTYSSFENALQTCYQQKNELSNWLKKERQEICRREKHLALSQQIARVGSWEIVLEDMEKLEQNHVYCSDETYRILGLEPGEIDVTGAFIMGKVHPNDRQAVDEAMLAAIKTGAYFNVQHRLLVENGVEKIVHALAEVTKTEGEGQPIVITGTLQDITTESIAKANLEKNSHEINMLFENMEEGFFSVDVVNNQVLQISKACEKIWGYPKQAFIENPYLWQQVVVEEDKPAVAESFAACQNGLAVTHAYRILHKNGSTRWLQSKIIPTVNSEGVLLRIDGMIADITERKEAEKTIADNELTNRIFFEQSLAAIYRTTITGEIIYCNMAFANMLGFNSPNELVHQNITDFYLCKPDSDTFFTGLRERKALVDINLPLKHRNGSILHVLENSAIYVDPATGIEYCDGIMINITERKKAEDKLYASEKRYRQIVETAQEGIWTIDEREQTNFVNKKICDILEYSPEEMMGKGLYDFMDEEGKKYAIACMERRRKGSKENLDIRYITKTGREVWANISANPIIDDDGTYRGALAMVTDITDRKHHDELLQKSEANLRTIFDHADSSFLLLDADFKIISFNAMAQTAMLQQADLPLRAGEHLLAFVTAERQPAIKDILQRVVNGETVSYQICLTPPGGVSKWYDVKWVGVPYTGHTTKWGIMVSGKDVTQEKIISLERERMTTDLVQRNKDLQQFNYIVSHNLRAPVANIMGLTSLLADDGGDAEFKRELVKGLGVSIKNLDGIIKDLSHILQVREQRIHESKEDVMLTQLVEEIKTSIGNIIKKENAVLECSFVGTEHLFTIRSYIHSIFYNLILNSIKYKRTGVYPVIKITGSAQGGMVTIDFADNGKGTDMVRNGKEMFGLYKRFDSKVEGKGIGLFIVKAQVESLGGTISVTSEVGKGTTFSVVLPV